MNATPLTEPPQLYDFMVLNSRDILIPSAYQRELNVGRAAKIADEFDERIANEPKVSFRDGKYFVFDGQHTIAARKTLNHGNNLLIRCKVYRDMTEAEEALLFAKQTGVSAKLSSSVEIKANMVGGDNDARAFRAETERVGFFLGSDSGRCKRRIICIKTAFAEYKRVGRNTYKEALYIISQAWDGNPEALRMDMLKGLIAFVETYKGKYDRRQFIFHLSRIDPVTIYRKALYDFNLKGTKRFINQFYIIYNGDSKTDPLPVKF